MQAGVGGDFAERAFFEVGGGDDAVFEFLFAESGFEHLLDNHKLRSGFGGLARFAYDVENRFAQPRRDEVHK